MNEELLKALATIAVGALAGGFTNTVAIWMLFHPYRPPKLGARRLRFLQGAVPKNQLRLAAAIGRTVGDRLLTPDDLARILAQPEFRDAFDERLDQFLRDLLEVDRGSLREILGPEMSAEAARIAGEIFEHALPRFEAYLNSAHFEDAVRRRAGRLAESIDDAPVGDALTPALELRIRTAVDEWVERTVDGEGFRETVADYVQRGADRLLVPGKTVQDVLPPGVGAALEKAVSRYLPLAVRRLGGILEDPTVRGRFEAAVHDVLRRFLRDLKFHQRVVARLVVNEEAVEKVLDAIQVEGAGRIARMMREGPVQSAMAKGIADAVAELLERPVVDVLGEPDDPAVARALDALVSWIVDAARSPGARSAVSERVEAVLANATGRSWGDLAGGFSPDRVATWVAEVARSDAASAVYREGARRLAATAFDRPLGRPARLLPGDAPAKVGRVAAEPLWTWLQGQIPALVRRLDVARRVEEKIKEFPVEKMEELVRRVTNRELRTIVWLGYALGAFIGSLLVATDLLWS